MHCCITSLASVLYLIAYLLTTSVTSAQSSCNTWSLVPGGLKHVSTSINFFWGVTAGDAIYVCSKPCTGAWKRIPGGLTQVDVSDGEVWGVNKQNYIYKRQADGGGATWIKVKGKLKHVSASGNGYIWGTTAANNVYKCRKPCDGAWIHVPGKLKQIDGGEEYVFGVSVSNDVYFRRIDGTGNRWSRIGRKMKYISAGSGEIFGVDTSNKVFRCKLPCKGGAEWKLINSNVRMNQVEAAVGGLVGTTIGRAIYQTQIDYIY